jgi:hypothetical protein
MRKLLVTTGGTEVGWSRHNDEGVFRDYQAEAERLMNSAKPYGIDCIIYTNEYFYNSPYYKEHRDVMDKVSFGFTMKSIELYDTFKEMEYGDIVILTDSNHFVAQDPEIIYYIADQYDCFIYDHIWVKYKNKEFTRRDTFVNMGCDEERYWDSIHVQCNLWAFKKTPKTEDFAREYHEDALTYKIMFGEDKYPNFPEFRVHRHDQSIFSILREKYNFPYVIREKSENLWTEYVIPEVPVIKSENPVDNSHRKEEDSKENA